MRTIQAKLSDNLTMTLDGFYSHFKDGIDQKGFEMPFNCGGGCGHDFMLERHRLRTASSLPRPSTARRSSRITARRPQSSNIRWLEH